jgi:hypothetical protein
VPELYCLDLQLKGYLQLRIALQSVLILILICTGGFGYCMQNRARGLLANDAACCAELTGLAADKLGGVAWISDSGQGGESGLIRCVQVSWVQNHRLALQDLLMKLVLLEDLEVHLEEEWQPMLAGTKMEAVAWKRREGSIWSGVPG